MDAVVGKPIWVLVTDRVPIGQRHVPAVLRRLLGEDPVVRLVGRVIAGVGRTDVADVGLERQPDDALHALALRFGDQCIDLGTEDGAGVVVADHRHDGVAELAVVARHRLDAVVRRVALAAPARLAGDPPARLGVEQVVVRREERRSARPAQRRERRITEQEDAVGVVVVGRGRPRANDDDAES